MSQVVSLYRYPIKGFEGEALDSVSLSSGKGVPDDRVAGIARDGVAKHGCSISSIDDQREPGALPSRQRCRRADTA